MYEARPLEVVAPRRFAPDRSVLGRLTARFAGDRRVGEGLYYACLCLLIAAVLFVIQWAGLLLPTHMEAVAVFAVQVLLGLGAVAFGLIGWQPALQVKVDSGMLELGRGDARLRIPTGAISHVRRVTAEEVHLHWSRFRRTHLFMHRATSEALLLRTADGNPVVIGLSSGDLARLARALADRSIPTSAVHHSVAAPEEATA